VTRRPGPVHGEGSERRDGDAEPPWASFVEVCIRKGAIDVREQGEHCPGSELAARVRTYGVDAAMVFRSPCG